MSRTIAQYCIQRWLEGNFFTNHLKIEFIEDNKARITDKNADTAIVVYNDGEVYLDYDE